jgi:hypothetical protein
VDSELVVAKVLAFKRLIRARRSKLDLRVSMVVTTLNADAIAQARRFWRRHGIRLVTSVCGDQHAIHGQGECYRLATAAIRGAARYQHLRTDSVSVSLYLLFFLVFPDIVTRSHGKHVSRDCNRPDTEYAEDDQYYIHSF